MIDPKLKNCKNYKNPRKHQQKTTKEGKIYDIRERTFQFSNRIWEIADALPKNQMFYNIRNQLLKSGTSIGANIEEADGSISKRDFLNKANIARKEAKETRYWLRLLSYRDLKDIPVDDDIEEAQEIINILSVMINKTRKSKEKRL